MRVLAVSSFWHPRGGDTTCLFGMVRALTARGHDVVPFAMRHPDNLPSVWETRWPPAREYFGLSRIQQLLRVPGAIWSPGAAHDLAGLLDDTRPDIAHIHHLHRHLTPSILGPLRKRGIPVVWTVHDYELICPSAHLYAKGAYCDRCRGHRYQEAVRLRCRRDDALQSAAVALEKWVHARRHIWERVDLFLCPSRFLAARLVEFGVDPTRVAHHPNFVEEAPAAEGPGEGWLYAGRLAIEKGVDDLIEAARRLPGVPLTIVGDGAERDRLERIAPPWVRFTGQVPPDEVAVHQRRARVIAVPSRWPENDPYAVLEAQMAARPVVATRSGGMIEQIEDGVDGRLVPLQDPIALATAVEEFVQDSRAAERIGSAARARVRRERNPLDWVVRLESHYRALVA